MSVKRSFTSVAILSYDFQKSDVESVGSCEAKWLSDESVYQEIKFLGRGASGDVILANKREDPSKQVAIKLLPRGREKVSKRMERELITQNSLLHPHIVRLETAVLFETDLAIVLEYMPGGNLHEYCYEYRRKYKVRAIPEARVKSYMEQLFMALHYMHQKQVVNRDIKLENLLLDETHRKIKLADFGLAKGPQDSNPKSDVGTLCHKAPEVMEGGKYDGKLADIWSCGICLYRLLFYDYPFVTPGELDQDRLTAGTYRKIVQRTCQGDYRVPMRSMVSNEGKDLISRCLQPDPQKRASLSAILDHSWFRSEFSREVHNMTEDCLKLKPSPITDQELRDIAEGACQGPHQ